MERHTAVTKVKYSHKAVCGFIATLSHVDILAKPYQWFIQAENIDDYLGNVCWLGNHSISCTARTGSDLEESNTVITYKWVSYY